MKNIPKMLWKNLTKRFVFSLCFLSFFSFYPVVFLSQHVDEVLRDAKALKNAGKYDAALEEIDRVTALYADSLDWLYRFHITKGGIYGKMYRFDKQMEEHLIGLDLVRKYNHGAGENRVLLNIGNSFFQQEKYRDALLYYQQSTNLSKDANDSLCWAFSLKNMSIAMLELDSVQASIYPLERSTSLYEQMGNGNGVRKNLISFGKLYEELGDYEKAVVYLKRYLEESSQEIDHDATALNNLGHYFTMLGQPDSAIFYLKKCVQISTKHELRNELDLSTRNLAQVYKSEGKLDSAYKYLEINRQLQRVLLNAQREDEILMLQEKFETEKKESIIEEKTFETRILIAGLIVIVVGGLGVFVLIKRNQRIRVNLAREQVKRKESEISNLFSELTLQRAKYQSVGELQERKRLSRELHDRIGSLLAAVKLRIAAVPVPEDYKEALAEGLKLLDSSVEEVRRVSHNLKSGTTSNLSLVQSVQELAQRLEKNSGIVVKFHHYQMQEHLQPELESSLYAVICELAQNTLKYAQASQITIDLSRDENELSLIFEDDGKGFEINSISSGIGLSNIRERIELLEGALSIDSKIGRGTAVIVEIPIR